MIIGFIGFGKVSKNLFNLIKSDEITFITSDEGRSQNTMDNIKKEGIEVLNTFREVALNSDILISANSPKNALTAAKKYGKYAKGIYLDLNNISPDTTMKINDCVDSLVDGAIIGKIDSEYPVLYLAGSKSEELKFLDEFIEIKIISSNVGDASLLKLLRSIYTKSVSALLIESVELARDFDLEDEFFEVLSTSEGDDFKSKSLSRISNTINGSERKSEELEEIIDYFDNHDLTMVKAALKKLNQ